MPDPSRLTVVTPTKNKSLQLQKTLTYYVQVGLQSQIMIDDASDGEHLEMNQKLIQEVSGNLNIAYRERPGTGHHTAYGELLKEVNTPYVLLAGDDDFFVPKHLLKCVNVLDRNSDFSAAWGTVVDVRGNFRPDHSFEFKHVSAWPSKDFLADRPSQRLLEFCHPVTYVTTHSVYRTEPIRHVWRRCLELYGGGWKSANFFEMAYNAFMAIHGKQKCLPGLFHVWVRAGGRIMPAGFRSDRFEVTLNWNWKEHLPATMELISTELVKQEGIDYEEAYTYAQEVWLGFIIPWLTVYRNGLMKKHGLVKSPSSLQILFERLSRYDLPTLVKKIGAKLGNERISLSSLLSPSSPYYGDFMPIYRVLATSSTVLSNTKPDRSV